MPKLKLTERVAESLRPAERRELRVFDEHTKNLVLSISYGGRKTWFALYYIGGKPRYSKLGEYRPLNEILERWPGDANAKRADRLKAALLAAAKCEPPILSVESAREAARLFVAPTGKAGPRSFKTVAEDFLKRHVEGNGLLTAPEYSRMLKKYVYPKWEHRLFVEIKRRDVAELLDQIVDDVQRRVKKRKAETGKALPYDGKRQADVVLAIVRKICNWYQSRDDDYVSPIVRGMSRTPSGERRRKRTLSHEEVRAVWREAGKLGNYGAFIRLLLLTAQRKEKVIGIKHDHVADGVWTLPVHPREKGHIGRVKLPQAAVDLIIGQPRVDDNSYIFPSDGQLRFNSFSEHKRMLDDLLREQLPNMPRWTIHDLRRTARSLMSEAGVSSEHAERVMGHALPGVEGVYDRYAYFAEKSAALEKLAALIAQIVRPQRVSRQSAA